MAFLKHPLTLALVVLGGLYAVFAHILNPPLPASLLIQYMIICTVGVLLVVTFDNATAGRFFAPLVSLFGSPQRKVLRAVALVATVAGVGALTYDIVKPSIVSPAELRTVHPAPPSSLKAYGKTFNLLTLENPFRAEFDEASDEYREIVAEGAGLYYENCVYCHGDLLDGAGHFAGAFTPRPINFQDVGTIAQLQEAFLFWRITKGGPGLPVEGTPWASAMPVWEDMLQEHEVWKIISFLYDYTGFEPRSWELEESTGGAEEGSDTAAEGAALDEGAVDAIYTKRCSQCHGDDGDGLGIAAERMYPAPRDFTLGLFKYKTTDSDSEFPTDADLRETIREGLPGTAMPGWKTILSDAEIDALIYKIKTFGYWEEETAEDLGLTAIELGTPPEVTDAALANGRVQFEKACRECHGNAGRGNIMSGKRLADDWENRIWPRNLTQPETWRWSVDAKDVFQRLSAGIPSTPMPEHSTNMSLEDRWAVANYVMTLRNNATPLSKGDSVIRAVRVDGDLPSDGDDPAWDGAPAMTFRLSPNVIKEPRLFFSLNEMVTVRALYNADDIALRVDVDDRTYSVPGSALEQQYALDDVTATRDAIAVQIPAALTGTAEKPYFRQGDRKNSVNIWHWTAPSQDPELPATVVISDAKGQEKAPTPRADSSDLRATGTWKDGRWQVVFTRALDTGTPQDLQFDEGVYTPIAFANWDGLNGEIGLRQSFTAWYWILLEPVENPTKTIATAVVAGLLAGLVFLLIGWRARRRFTA
ncbi:MAG: DMSO reductase family type II enzyme heme b subunit [Paracoccaceae bacterium]|jgi:DMSO reductase family type II enzyme heme b subunit